MIKYPEIKVKLTGTDGNALAIVGNVKRALQRAGVGRDELEAFQAEALSGDYDNVLQTAMRWVNVR